MLTYLGIKYHDVYSLASNDSPKTNIYRCSKYGKMSTNTESRGSSYMDVHYSQFSACLKLFRNKRGRLKSANFTKGRRKDKNLKPELWGL